MGLSGRRTLGLQETGLATIHKQYKNEEITHDPVLYSYDEHYDRFGVWRGKGFGIISKTKPILSQEERVALEKKPRTLSHYFELLKVGEADKIREVPPFDLKKYSFVRRTKDKEHWPVANTNGGVFKEIRLGGDLDLWACCKVSHT